MTQQPQEGFDRSVEDARAWMKAVQERLQINDNTQGPRAALEARLWETEVRRSRGRDSPAALAVSLPLRPPASPLLKGSISQTLMYLNLLGILVEVQIWLKSRRLRWAPEVASLTCSRRDLDSRVLDHTCVGRV